MSEHSDTSGCARRRFLRTTAFGAAGLGAAGGLGVSLTGCGDSNGEGPGSGSGDGDSQAVHEGSSWESVFAEEELAVGATADVEVSDHHLVLHRASEEQVHVFEAVCTHEGCRVEAEEQRFFCPCHGSVFGLDSGHAEAGPAREPLTRVESRIQDGQLQIHL